MEPNKKRLGNTVIPTNYEPETPDVEPCDDPHISQLVYAPYRVPYVLNDDGELRVESAGVEMLDAEWNETDSWWCHNCDTEIEGKEAAVEHLRAGQ